MKGVAINYFQFILNNPKKLMSIIAFTVYPYMNYDSIISYILRPLITVVSFSLSAFYTGMSSLLYGITNILPSFDYTESPSFTDIQPTTITQVIPPTLPQPTAIFPTLPQPTAIFSNND